MKNQTIILGLLCIALTQACKKDLNGATSSSNLTQTATSTFVLANRLITLPVSNIGKSNQCIYIANVQAQLNPQPGDTLDIPAIYGDLLNVSLKNITGGTPSNPVIITCKGSNKLQIGGYPSYAFALNNSSNVKVIGLKINGRGISQLGITSQDAVSNITYKFCYVKNTAGPGFFIKCNVDLNNPATYYPAEFKNIIIKNCRADSTGTEGFYLGNTLAGNQYGKIPAMINGIYLIKDTATNTGWDGIQLSGAVHISGNDLYVRNAGVKNTVQQRSGITIQTNTKVDNLYNLDIANGNGSGLFLFSRGTINISNIKIANVGKQAGEVGIYVDDKAVSLFQPTTIYGLDSAQKLNLTNVTINGSGHQAVNIVDNNHTMLPGFITNLLYYNVGTPAITDNANNVIN